MRFSGYFPANGAMRWLWASFIPTLHAKICIFPEMSTANWLIHMDFSLVLQMHLGKTRNPALEVLGTIVSDVQRKGRLSGTVVKNGDF
jgi:hypothetical protein